MKQLLDELVASIEVSLELSASVIVKSSTALEAPNSATLLVMSKDLQRIVVEAHWKVELRLARVVVELRQRRALRLNDQLVKLEGAN